MIKMEKVEKKKSYGVVCNTLEDYENDLKENYNKPGHPVAFSGIDNIYDYYRGILPKHKIKSILSTIENYTLHKEYKKGQRNPSFSHFPRYQFQADLVDVQQRAKYNSGVRYLLTVIDTFTRMAFVRMLTDKTAETVLEAFKSILNEAVTPPMMIICDRGTEFQNYLFKQYCLENNIKLFVPDTSVHAAYIERFNLTLQTLIEKYLTENQTEKYADKLEEILATYNNRKHRMTQHTPIEAETNPETHLDIRMNMSKYYETIKSKKVTFNIGDTVRIASIKGKFSRGYQQKSSLEIFKIAEIDTDDKLIPLYYLESYDGCERIKGGFYDYELTATNLETFRIEKVIKKRIVNGEEELFVKWLGFDPSYNSWIKSKDVTHKF